MADKKRRSILLRLDEALFKRMQHARIESKHSTVNAWMEEAVIEKLEREVKKK